jgi:predicted ribosomally synthesized peptide with SipW-like signal peptide
MTTLDEHNSGDYVLVHKNKAKISRARKFIIGTMMVGAVAAIAGAGTFASFSASTTNEGSFSTARMAITNNTDCVTPAGVAGTGVASNDVDVNNQVCDALFPDPLKPGELATKDVEIENVGDVSGALKLYALSACDVSVKNASFDMGTADDLCDRVVISIDNLTTGKCLYPSGASACTALSQTTPVHGEASAQSFNDFSADHQFTTAIDVLPSSGTELTTTGLTNKAKVRVSVYWRQSKGTTACNAAFSNHTPGITATDTDNDGFIDGDGTGCDNPYMNQKATLNLRWQIQG